MGRQISSFVNSNKMVGSQGKARYRQQCVSRWGPRNAKHTKNQWTAHFLWVNWTIDALKKSISPETAVYLSDKIFFSSIFWFHFNFLENATSPFLCPTFRIHLSILVDCLEHVGFLCWLVPWCCLSILPLSYTSGKPSSFTYPLLWVLLYILINPVWGKSSI